MTSSTFLEWSILVQAVKEMDYRAAFLFAFLFAFQTRRLKVNSMTYLLSHLLLPLDRFFVSSKCCTVCLEYIYLPSKVVFASCQLDIELTAITSWYRNKSLQYLPGFRFW